MKSGHKLDYRSVYIDEEALARFEEMAKRLEVRSCGPRNTGVKRLLDALSHIDPDTVEELLEESELIHLLDDRQ